MRRLLAGGLLALCLCLWGAAPARADRLTVFAAASLKTALDEIGRHWRATGSREVAFSFAGSSALARQIEAGAPADVFISANVAWMDHLAAKGLIQAATRRDLLANSLALIAYGDPPPLAIEPGFDLAGRLGNGRLAMALVDAVPAGIYGKAALTSLGVWESLKDKVAQTDNVRAALALVAVGEAPYGVVYLTDAKAVDVALMGLFPPETHPPILYPGAALSESGAPDAAAFLDFLSSEAARGIFIRQGFKVLP